MERRGVISRSNCADDGRGATASLIDAGWAVLQVRPGASWPPPNPRRGEHRSGPLNVQLIGSERRALKQDSPDGEDTMASEQVG
jgi:hypothetical protein